MVPLGDVGIDVLGDRAVYEAVREHHQESAGERGQRDLEDDEADPQCREGGESEGVPGPDLIAGPATYETANEGARVKDSKEGRGRDGADVPEGHRRLDVDEKCNPGREGRQTKHVCGRGG